MSSVRSAITRGLIALSLALVAGGTFAHPTFAALHAAKTITVKMQLTNGSYVFNPAKLTIHVGDTVKWVDVGSTPHNIVGQGNAASIIKKMAIDSKSYSVTFKKAGTYKYVCQVHLPGMVGQVVVK